MARSAIGEVARTVVAAAPASPRRLDEQLVHELLERAWAGDEVDPAGAP
jgi:hypothetical protein